MANVYILRAMCIHGVRLMPQYKTQLRLRYSTLSGISNVYFARPGTEGTSASLLQKVDSLYSIGSAPSRCIFTETRLRNPAPERKPDNKVSLKRSAPPASTTQKVKEAGKDLTYLIVVLIGIGITGGLFYVIFKELFSSSSPSKIFGDALKKCRAHPEIIGALGEPIKGYGETSRRGRRRHVRILKVEGTTFVIYLWTLTLILKGPLLLKTTGNGADCICFHELMLDQRFLSTFVD
ncbi:mitochondrial import inner membrane translocase subunit Tim21 isoform X2 [Scyliorhinus canicula]|uniref:mitochondrial import inner membrane translocase subunit Tim21 isoform X2 n=1 Tax=Scyliorhinus canicula TaxID=7830 RepID=UPI0018F56DCB|nr:mitochondrial import inner membrane translocase subunit Tim21 isoform X2 [Scyliorhinus canicula]